jgi:NifU-like protein involved in Fe-S cluster formation
MYKLLRSKRAQQRNAMADLDNIYNTKILELAASIPRTGQLKEPDGRGEAHSKLCGSTISVELSLTGDQISDFAQNVKACLLGQAAASVVGREIVGTPIAEFREVAASMRRMLKENGAPPSGRWSDLALLEPVREYRHRHASTLLVFDAVERAIAGLGVSEHGAALAG